MAQCQSNGGTMNSIKTIIMLALLAGITGPLYAGAPSSINHMDTHITTVKIPECSICLDTTDVTLPCKHTFHGACLAKWLIKNPTCPYCRDTVPADTLQEILLAHNKSMLRNAMQKGVQQLIKHKGKIGITACLLILRYLYTHPSAWYSIVRGLLNNQYVRFVIDNKIYSILLACAGLGDVCLSHVRRRSLERTPVEE